MTPTGQRQGLLAFGPFVLLFLIAAGVRLLGLGNTDLWGDEAFSVMTAVGPVRNLVAALATGEPHPPLYPLLLAGWLRLFGRSELISRLPSAFCGVASVAVASALGRRFAAPNDRSGSDRAALVAGLLVALNPIQVWYSQEARMYEQVSLFAGLSTLSLFHLQLKRRRGILAYALAVVATAGSHYYGLLLPLSHGLALATRSRQGASLLRTWLIAAAVAGALYLPWVYLARGIFFGYTAARPGTVDLLRIALSSWVRLASGWSLSWPVSVAVAAVFTVFVVVGALVRPTSASDRLLRRILLFWLVTPFVAGFLISLVRPVYAERYLVVSSLPMVLLAARAVVAAYRHRQPVGLRAPLPGIAPRYLTKGYLAGSVALAIVVALAAGPLYNVWSGRYVKSTYNTHVKDTAALIRPNDAIILDGTSQSPLYSYYVNYPWTTYPLPRDVPLDRETTTRELQAIATRHGGAWIFLYATVDYDPGYLVARWLSQHAYRAFDDWAVTGRLQYYRFDDPANLAQKPVSIAFGTILQLTRYALDSRDIAAGDTVPIAFWWQRPDGGGPRMRISLRLVDQSGFTWAQSDQELGGDFFDVGDWPSGSPLEDHHGLLVPPGTPPGTYRLLLNSYRADDGQPLAVTGGGAQLEAGGLALGNVRLTRAANHVWTDGIAGYRSSNLRFGGSIELLGYAESSRVVAGDSGYLTLIWTALADQPPWTTLRLDVIAENGQVAQTRDLPIATGSYPASAWQVGDVLREQYHLPFRDTLAPGIYQLAVRPTGAAPSPANEPAVLLDRIVVEAAPPKAPVATPTNRLAYTLGGAIALDGFDLSSPTAKPGDQIQVTFHWRDVAPLTNDYTVFVHVLDATEKVVAQRDAPPVSGTRPTSSWFSGDVIVDSAALVLPAGLPAGTYPIEVGMYNPGDGARLPILKDGQPSGDRIILGRLEVVP